MTSTQLVARQTVEDIVAGRDRALELYAIAMDKIEEASAAVKAANEQVDRITSRATNNYTYEKHDEIERFSNAVALPERESYLRTARQLCDLRCWSHILALTDLERLMDTQEKDKLRNQMRYVPDTVKRRRSAYDHDDAGQLIDQDEIARGMPPITVGNIYATLEKFQSEAGLIFRRGIANVFSELDRRFRSHDGFKLGSRIILTYFFDRDSGRFAWGRTRALMMDIERVFAVLDGKPEASFQSALQAIELDRRGKWSPHQSEVETEYFLIRGFKNGNAHLWLRRDDLVVKVNKLLAEYYGEVIGDGQQGEDDPLENRKMTPARAFGFYPTPQAAADFMFGDRRHGSISVWRFSSEPQLRILEPSAGTGNLARRCVSVKPKDDSGWHDQYRFDNLVDCIEVQPQLASALMREGIYNRVVCADFLQVDPTSLQPYDIVVMNPPFDRERDIDHVVHAFKFLKTGGKLHAIMSAGTEFRETRKAAAFRKLMADHKGKIEHLPFGSFAEVGTNVNTIVVTMEKQK